MLDGVLALEDTKIILSPSEAFTFYIQEHYYKRHNVHRDYKIRAETDKQIRDALSNMTVSPLEGDLWVLNIEYDTKKTSQKVLEGLIGNKYGYGTAIIWVKEYRDFMRLTGSRSFKKYEQSVSIYKFSILRKEDMELYYSTKVPAEFRLSKELERYVYDNYNFDVNAFTDLVDLIEAGREFEKPRDFIEAVGLGRASIETLVFKMLRSSSKTASGVKSLFASCLMYLENLASKYSYRTIVNYMNSTLNTIIEMKELQIRGILGSAFFSIPEGYDAEKIARMKRYSDTIEFEITLIDALNLRLALIKCFNQDARIHLMTAFSDYMDYLYSKGGGDKGEAERQAIKERKKEEKKRLKEESI